MPFLQKTKEKLDIFSKMRYSGREIIFKGKQVITAIVPIILDTDMGPDVDDVGALALLHILARGRPVRLLVVTHCTSHPYMGAAVSAPSTPPTASQTSLSALGKSLVFWTAYFSTTAF